MSAALAHLLVVLAAWTLSIGSAASIVAGEPGLAHHADTVEGAPAAFDLGWPVELAELEEEEEDPSDARGRGGADGAMEGSPPRGPASVLGPVAPRGFDRTPAIDVSGPRGRGPRAPPV